MPICFLTKQVFSTKFNLKFVQYYLHFYIKYCVFFYFRTKEAWKHQQKCPGAPVFPLKMLVLLEKSSFLGYKKVFFPEILNFSKKKCLATLITTFQSGLLTKFLTPVMLFVLILYISGGINSLKSTPNNRFLEKLFHDSFIYSLSFCQKSDERESPKKYILYFILMSGLGLEPWLYV